MLAAPQLRCLRTPGIREEEDSRGVTWVCLDKSETVRDESQGRSEMNSSVS